MLLAIVVILALTFTITSAIMKKGYLAFAGSGAWIIACVSAFSQATTDWDTYFCLGFFFIFLALGEMFSPLAWRETTPAGEEPEEPDIRDMREEMESWNKERRQYNFLYGGNSANGKGKRGKTRYQRTK